MILHVFNPEHDMALAADRVRFTPPHAARQLRDDLDWLPVFWAAPGEAVLVGDSVLAKARMQRIQGRLRHIGVDVSPKAVFLTPDDLHKLVIGEVEPWGWDAALCSRLQHRGVAPDVLPDNRFLGAVRSLSHRREAASLLEQLQQPGLTVGKAVECRDMEAVEARVAEWGQAVMKAPWSSSGRGVRFVCGGTLSDNQAGWARNVIKAQGSIMTEPYYNKVYDFGMEYQSDGQGRIAYLGLSLFHTANGAYTGNLLATEAAKQTIVSRYIPLMLLEEMKRRVCRLLSCTVGVSYKGPFGLDMMVVRSEGGKGFLLHPCVEINLRRTMGHLAIALSPKDDDDLRGVMRIAYENGRYRLSVNRLKTNFL